MCDAWMEKNENSDAFLDLDTRRMHIGEIGYEMICCHSEGRIHESSRDGVPVNWFPLSIEEIDKLLII